MIMHQTSLTFEKVFGVGEQQHHVNLVYDVAHNIAKIERHLTNGEGTDDLAHRKGATRAFPAGLPQIPIKYRTIGQPVI